MESDLYKLCNLLTLYRQSLAGILDKIDEKIHHALSYYENTHTKDFSTKKYKISMQMIEVLQNHVKAVHTYANVSETLGLNLAHLERDTQPEKENSYPNPFVLPSLTPAVKIEQNLPPEIFRSGTKENVHAGILIADDRSAKKQYRSAKIEQNYTSPETNRLHTTANTVLVERDEVHRDGCTQGQCPGVVNEQKIRFDNFIQKLTNRSGDSSDSTESSSDTLKAGNENVDYKEHGIQAIVVEKECQVVENFESEEATNSQLSPVEDELEETTETQDLSSVEDESDELTKTQDLSPAEGPSMDEGAKSNEPFIPIECQSTDNFEERELSIVQNLPPMEKPCSKEGAKTKKQVTFNLDQASKPEPPRYDWRQEAIRLFENRRLKVGLRWKNSDGQIPDDNIEDEGKPGSFVIEEDDLSVGQRCDFSHIESPSEFYVCTNRTLLESFEEHINEVMNKHWLNVLNKFKSKPEAREHLGNFCFGYLTGRRKWYRVEVLNWMDQEPEKILIQLIDYGEKLCYSYTNLKKIADLLYSMFPKLAIRCHLAGVYSPHPSRTVWPQRSIEFFVESSEEKNQTEFEVIFVHKERNSYAVDLRKATDADADSLGELLIKNGYAFEERSSEDDFLSTIDEKELEENEDGYDSADKADDSEGASSEQKISKVLSTNNRDLPLDGDLIEIIVVEYIGDTCHFYARILRNFSSGEYFHNKFMRLVETMNANNMVQGYEAFTFSPEIGDFALVKIDTMWCRGYCVKYTDHESIEIFLVDFGYTVVKPSTDLRRMKEDFLHLPFQAIECILSNCKQKEGISEDMSLSFFNTLMKMKTFKAHVVECAHDVMRLEMWDMENVDMSKVLKNFGLGEDR